MKTKKKEKWVIIQKDAWGDFIVANSGSFGSKDEAEEVADSFSFPRKKWIAKLEEVE